MIDFKNIKLFNDSDDVKILEDQSDIHINNIDRILRNTNYDECQLRQLRLGYMKDIPIFINYELIYSLIEELIPELLDKFKLDFYLHTKATNVDTNDVANYIYYDNDFDMYFIANDPDDAENNLFPDPRYTEIAREVFTDQPGVLRLDFSNRSIVNLNNIGVDWFTVGNILCCENDNYIFSTDIKLDEIMQSIFYTLKDIIKCIDTQENLKCIEKNIIIELLKNKNKSYINKELTTTNITEDTDEKSIKSLNIVLKHVYDSLTKQRIHIHEQIFKNDTKKFMTFLKNKDNNFKNEFMDQINKQLNRNFKSKETLIKATQFISRK